MSWMDAAACSYSDRRWFFGPGSEIAGAKRRREVVAKMICARCPVRRECLMLAIVTPVRYGVWGGAGEDERAEMRRIWLRQREELKP